MQELAGDQRICGLAGLRPLEQHRAFGLHVVSGPVDIGEGDAVHHGPGLAQQGEFGLAGGLPPVLAALAHQIGDPAGGLLVFAVKRLAERADLDDEGLFRQIGAGIQ